MSSWMGRSRDFILKHHPVVLNPVVARVLYVAGGIAYPVMFFLWMTADKPFTLSSLCTVFFWVPVVALWAFLPHRYARRAIRPLRRLIVIDALASAAILVVCVLWLLISGAFPGSGWFMVLAFRIPVDLLTLLFLPTSAADDSILAVFLKTLRSSTAAVVLCSFGVAAVVIARAEGLAHGRPYCLQVADWRRLDAYRAPSIVDLSAWRMRAYPQWGGGADDLVQQANGILVVEDGDGYDVRNWSYRSLDFRNDADHFTISRHVRRRDLAAILPGCAPEAHYGLSLLDGR